jgi:hypothetical protein
LEVLSPDCKRSLLAKNQISELKPTPDVDISVFISALESVNFDVFFSAEIALSHLSERVSAAMPRLALPAMHEALFLRQQAAIALARIRASDPYSLQAVFDAFDDEVAFVRRETFQTYIGFPIIAFILQLYRN